MGGYAGKGVTHSRNYTIFYVVIGDTMEVRRIIYSRRDMSRKL